MANKQVVVTAWGGPEVLNIVEDQHLPEPGPGEVRVRVLASSASFTDTMIRKGMYPDVKQKPPFTLGYDLVGVVDKLGEGVVRLSEGQHVAQLTVIGAQAMYVCLQAHRLVPVPSELDAAEAVSLVLSYMTAYQMLHRVAKVEKGRKILVHGAGGAVGTAMLQLGKLMDLEMIGTASAGKHKRIEALGAVAIDYRNEDVVQRVKDTTSGEGVEVVFDPIGGRSFSNSMKCLKKDGVMVAYGFYNAVMGKGGSVPLDFMKLKLWNLIPNGRSTTFYSIGSWREKHADWFHEDLVALFDLLKAGRIEPAIHARMPVADVRLAHQLVEQAQVDGKIVLMMDPEN